MTDFLSIAGNPYGVDRSGATESARDYAGSNKRAFDNTLRNMTRSAKRTWTFTLSPMPAATLATLDAATSLRQPVTCSGDGLGGASVTCCVTLTAAPYVSSDLTFLRGAMVTLQEV